MQSESVLALCITRLPDSKAGQGTAVKKYLWAQNVDPTGVEPLITPLGQCHAIFTETGVATFLVDGV